MTNDVDWIEKQEEKTEDRENHRPPWLDLRSINRVEFLRISMRFRRTYEPEPEEEDPEVVISSGGLRLCSWGSLLNY